jgi:hypothetical protein
MQEKERSERLKAIKKPTHTVPPVSAPIVAAPNTQEMFKQMKKILSTKKIVMTDGNTQTDLEYIQAKLDTCHQFVDFIDLLLQECCSKSHHISKPKEISYFEAVCNAYNVFEARGQSMEPFLEIAYRTIRNEGLNEAQRFQLASLAYTTVSKVALLSKYSHRSKILIYLIVLSGVAQNDVVLAILERLLQETIQDPVFVVQKQGHQVLQKLDFSKQDQTMLAWTTNMIYMSDHGIPDNDKVLGGIDQLVLEKMMKRDYSAKVLENISVLMQRRSKHP